MIKICIKLRTILVCLKDFLCLVRHDRKFFLLETLSALNRLMNEKKQTDFNINSLISAFEAISQYANNLFTKPWRKEFRLVKVSFKVKIEDYNLTINLDLDYNCLD